MPDFAHNNLEIPQPAWVREMGSDSMRGGITLLFDSFGVNVLNTQIYENCGIITVEESPALIDDSVLNAIVCPLIGTERHFPRRCKEVAITTDGGREILRISTAICRTVEDAGSKVKDLGLLEVIADSWRHRNRSETEIAVGYTKLLICNLASKSPPIILIEALHGNYRGLNTLRERLQYGLGVLQQNRWCAISELAEPWSSLMRAHYAARQLQMGDSSAAATLYAQMSHSEQWVRFHSQTELN
jgi:hypothetical protein